MQIRAHMIIVFIYPLLILISKFIAVIKMKNRVVQLQCENVSLQKGDTVMSKIRCDLELENKILKSQK